MAKGVLTLKVLGDTKGFEKSMGGIGSTLGKVGKAVAVAGTAVAAGMGVAGAKVLELGARFEDMDRKAKVVFEDQLGAAEKWAKSQAGAMGLTSRELLGLTANFTDLLKPMGFTAQQATEMAQNTNELSGALSKWSGGQRTAAEVSQILAKAMLGERDGLKELGISILESDVQARLAAKGQKELTGAALEQAKAIATQELIMEKSVDAQKAWAESQDDLSVKINTVKARVLEFRDQAVAALLPHVVNIAEKFLEWGSVVAEKLTPILRDLKAWWDENGPAIVTKVTELAGVVKDILVGAFNAVVDVFGWVKEHADILIPVVAGLLTMFLGYQAVVGVMAAITLGTQLWAGAQALLNTVMALNPIGAIILIVLGLAAALVTAYQTSETFRAGFDRVWSAVKSGVVSAANFVLRHIDGMINGIIDGVNSAIGALNKLPGVDVGKIDNVSVGRIGSEAVTAGSGSGSGLQEFADGGVVGGPRGAKQLAYVHGGETVLPTHKGGFQMGGNVTVNVAGSVISERDLEEVVAKALVGRGRRNLSIAGAI